MLDERVALACKEMIKKGSSSFYHAFKILPRQQREAVYVIYAFCRMIDDAVDDPDESIYTLEELDYHFTHLDQADGHFIWPALRWVMDTFQLSKEPYYVQMSGQRLDYYKTTYDTMDDLEDYCYRVAGSVGEMLIPVLHENSNQHVVEAGIALGKAMQIVNIIRDIGADQRLGRRYVPLKIMEKHGYSIKDWENQIVNDSLRAVIRDLTNQADQWFNDGLLYIHEYPRKSALSMKLAAGYYREIIQVVEENDYQVFTQRAIVTNKRKSKLLLQLTT
ncbi:All-trans-phytoene synthase [Paraliobacillus sp. PM-2]|uniref:phytoene/squalene synthase family protein n=1 Tax=Paraliobacillus sp. PM-2 TaxID=1462524 RepID=UPI00061C21E6|nr:phytoene/squalene synthase family protein [Paraliobacillus sp. PM-2]CQR48391.1 All-trans-phytoene synthase [Paraliobacillus sp. PM-2]